MRDFASNSQICVGFPAAPLRKSRKQKAKERQKEKDIHTRPQSREGPRERQVSIRNWEGGELSDVR